VSRVLSGEKRSILGSRVLALDSVGTCLSGDDRESGLGFWGLGFS
jgi:hypothetical protein